MSFHIVVGCDINCIPIFQVIDQDFIFVIGHSCTQLGIKQTLLVLGRNIRSLHIEADVIHIQHTLDTGSGDADR